MTKEPETIGGYTVHPVASLFPLLDGEEYESLKDSIRFHGQQVPIIVQGDTLLDGRNRMRACLDLKCTPVIEEYRATLTPGEYIFQLNFERRDLTADQRVTIAFAAEPLIREEGRARQRQGGQIAGKGRPKQVATKSSQPKSRAPDTRTRLAEKAGVSQHKAQQLLHVAMEAPELLPDVKAGKMHSGKLLR